MLKGKSTIQLFDKDTGKLQASYHDENMVTNAMTNLLNPKPHSYFGAGEVLYSISKTTPLATNALGGIILWRDALTETAGTILPPAGCSELAHAGVAYIGTAANRGTYNENESGAIDGGYRHVWDFGTDRANGSFRALSLTSKKGGAIGWQSAENSALVIDDLYTFPSSQYNMSFSRAFVACMSTMNHVCVGRFSDNVYTFAIMQNGVTLKNIACVREDSVGLTIPIGNGAEQNTLENEMSYTDITSSLHFCVTADGLVGFCYKIASLNYMLTFINPVTLEIQRTVMLQTEYDYDMNSDFAFFGGEYYFKRNGAAFVDVLNTDGSVARSIAVQSNSYNMFIMGNGLCFSGSADLFYCYDGSSVVRLPPLSGSVSRVIYDCSTNYPYILCSIGYNASYAVISSYLATINNLDYVITKTDTQTMKITYELYND